MFFKKKIKFLTRERGCPFKKYEVNNESYSGAKLIFSPDVVFDVKAIGNLDFFKGTAKFVDGFFSVKDLSDAFFTDNNLDENKCFFVNSTEFDFHIESFVNKNIKKHIVIITDAVPKVFHIDTGFLKNKNFSLNQWLKSNNITLITGFGREQIEFYEKNYLDYQNKGCCIVLNNEFIEKEKEIFDYFYNKDDNTNERHNLKTEIETKYAYFQSSKDESIYDISKSQKSFLQCRNLLSLFEKKYTIALIDFGIPNSSLSLIKYYFNVVVIDYRQIGSLYGFYRQKSGTLKINNKKISGIILSSTCLDNFKLDTCEIENIKKLCNMNMPVIGFGFGSELLCKTLGGDVVNTKTNCMLNTYEIRNNENKFFKVSKFDNGFISIVPNGLSATFYDNHNHNIICCENRKYFCCCFDLMFNGIDTVYIMNKIFNKIKYYIK